MKVLFLGERLPHARTALRELLPDDEIACCPAAEPGCAVRDADVLVPLASAIDGAMMDAGPVRLIHQFGAGLDGVDLAAARERAIPVARVPMGDTGGAEAVAEVAVLHLLLLARRYPEGREALRAARVGEPLGRGVGDMNVVVVGMGAVGRATAALLRALGATVFGVGRGDDLLGALAAAEAVVLCCPLNEQTRGLIGARELAAMAPGSLLVNVARGAVVDRDALHAALRAGQLRGAGLDVFWEEPIDPVDPLLAEHVTTTPHIGAVTEQVNQRMAALFAANVERLRQGEPLTDRVV